MLITNVFTKKKCDKNPNRDLSALTCRYCTKVFTEPSNKLRHEYGCSKNPTFMSFYEKYLAEEEAKSRARAIANREWFARNMGNSDLIAGAAQKRKKTTDSDTVQEVEKRRKKVEAAKKS